MILEGPYSELRIGEVLIEIFTRQGSRKRIDPKRHGKLAREAADRRPALAPNPCLVPLDPESAAEGGPFVFAKVTLLGPSPLIFDSNIEALTAPRRN